MKEIKVFRTNLNQAFKDKLTNIINNFDSFQGGTGSRNIIKIITIDSIEINVKAFKLPNIFNKVVYNFFRKSKAQRSYEYANKLIQLNIGTPKPLAYFEFATPFFFTKSYYVSKQQVCDLTYRELTTNLNYPNHEAILRAFTRFTFELHEKNIHFLDHSPGNTLIELNDGDYRFYLVDLNRMAFKPLDFNTRIKNFARLTIHKSMVKIMSHEYARCSGECFDKIFDLMWHETQAFQEKYHRKKRLKKKLKFWR